MADKLKSSGNTYSLSGIRRSITAEYVPSGSLLVLLVVGMLLWSGLAWSILPPERPVMILTSHNSGQEVSGAQNFCWSWEGGFPGLLDNNLVGLTIGTDGYRNLDKSIDRFARNSDQCIFVSSLPDSRHLFGRLWGLLTMGPRGWEWLYTDFRLLHTGAADNSEEPHVAAIVRPPPGTALRSSAQTFWWSDVEAADYRLTIGSRAHDHDIYDEMVPGGKRAVTVWGLPVDGTRIYVRLGSKDKSTGEWSYRVFEYVASSTDVTPVAATLKDYSDSRSRDDEPLRLRWDDVGSHLYFLRISKCGYDYYGDADFFAERFSPENTSAELPRDAMSYKHDLYIRLYTWSMLNHDWILTEYKNRYLFEQYPPYPIPDPCRNLRAWPGAYGSTFYILKGDYVLTGE